MIDEQENLLKRFQTSQFKPFHSSNIINTSNSNVSLSSDHTSTSSSSSTSPSPIVNTSTLSPNSSFLPMNTSLLVNARRILKDNNKPLPSLNTIHSPFRTSKNNHNNNNTNNTTINTTLNTTSDTTDISGFLQDKNAWEQRMNELELKLQNVHNQHNIQQLNLNSFQAAIPKDLG